MKQNVLGMISPSVAIAMTDIKSVLDRIEGGLVEKVVAAMREARHHWLVQGDDEPFRAAVGAVMLFYGMDSEEWKRLSWEMENINRFSAALAASQMGVGVDWLSVIHEEEQPYRPLGLIAMWKETK